MFLFVCFFLFFHISFLCLSVLVCVCLCLSVSVGACVFQCLSVPVCLCLFRLCLFFCWKKQNNLTIKGNFSVVFHVFPYVNLFFFSSFQCTHRKQLRRKNLNCRVLLSFVFCGKKRYQEVKTINQNWIFKVDEKKSKMFKHFLNRILKMFVRTFLMKNIAFSSKNSTERRKEKRGALRF